jgi:acetylornithine deacetylase/succinyl-diaminopimelate desuccinylase-like protein
MALPARSVLEQKIEAQRPAFEAALKTLLELPSVSPQAAQHRRDIIACAEAAVALLREAGATNARLVETGGLPSVVGCLGDDASAPTLTIYNHLDVQPADREGEGWQRDPWKLTIEGDRYYGRGATDDKGPALSALFAARLAREFGVRLNVQFLWESEEESGSPNFEKVFGTGALRPTNSVLVSDTIWIARGKPVVSMGLRGLAPALIKLETGTKDCHSGVAGGAARNPLAELAWIVTQCVDARTGEVKIPGFYDDVDPTSEEEKKGYVESGFSVQGFAEALGLKSMRSNDVADVTQRIWARPTFEVHGISGGYQGEGIKTAIPPRGEVKVSMRLVPRQDPEKVTALLAKHVKSICPDAVVEPLPGLAPYRGDIDDAWQRAARAAFQEVYGIKPALVREGGSIGAVATMKQHLKCPIVFMGLSLPEHGYHAPNEFFDWGQASGGMQAFLRYFDAISAL